MKTVIIDDEKNIRDGLKILLQAHPEINIIGEAKTVTEAQSKIESLKPELVFLDIKLKESTGFNLLDRLIYKNFNLIFITAYNKYAIKAFKYNAFDYLLKPIAPEELKETITRLKDSTVTFEKQQNIIKQNSDLNRIVIKTTEQIYVLDLKDIVRCESDQGYTLFYLKNNTKILSSKTLKEYNTLLPKQQFLRVHQSHLININFIKNYMRPGSIQLQNGETIPVSIRKRQEISNKIANLQ